MRYQDAKRIAARARVRSHNRTSFAEEMDKIAAFTRALPMMPETTYSQTSVWTAYSGAYLLDSQSFALLIGGKSVRQSSFEGFNISANGIYLDGTSHDGEALQSGDMEFATIVAVINPDSEVDNATNPEVRAIFGPTLPYSGAGVGNEAYSAPTPSQCAQAIRNAIALGNTRFLTEGGEPYQAAADGVGLVTGSCVNHNNGANIVGSVSPVGGSQSNDRLGHVHRRLLEGSCLFGDDVLYWGGWD